MTSDQPVLCSVDTGVVYLLSNYLETGVGVGAMLCHSGMCRSRGLAALVAVTGEKAVVERHKVDTRYLVQTWFLTFHVFRIEDFCTFSTTYKERVCVKKYIYCIDRMYDIYNKILRLIFTVYSG